ncbi:MAG TPA: HEAT repeat domain-containing protein [Verrucomicrobiae bacterium]|nr:HEAT repeat domain-containing protein [Verrucomicrobiae bacterium]
MQRLKIIFVIALASVTWLAIGCSKKESEPTPPPMIEKTKPRPVTPPAPPVIEPTPTPPPTAPTPEPAPTPPASSSEEETPAQLAAEVQQLESTYHNTPDFQKRVGIIYDITSVESPAAVDAIGRLFSVEPDPDLKTELIDSLSDIDGENDKKLNILTSALSANQPKDVRLEAIDAISDTEDKRGIQLLQPLLQDPDEEVRDAAKDSIDDLQSSDTNSATMGSP